MKRAYKSGFQKREERKKKKEEVCQYASSMYTWLKPTSPTSKEIDNEDTALDKSGELDKEVRKEPPAETVINETTEINDNEDTALDKSGEEDKEARKEPPAETAINETTEINDQSQPGVGDADIPDFPDVIADKIIKKAIIARGPCQPSGPFPKDPAQNGRSFSVHYYNSFATSGLKLNRTWLCYSSKLDCVYCLPCWLFSDQKGTPGKRIAWETGLRDWQHLTDRIKTHEDSDNHKNSCFVFDAWRIHGTVDEAMDKNLKNERNYWRKVLKRVIDVSLMLAICNLPFRGKSGNICDPNKGNFLSVIELLSEYDPILKELLQKPSGSINYLSPTIQNELISLLSEQVKADIVSEIQSAPFFSIIMDTTQDISKTDQLSEVFRYVKIINDDNGKPVEIKICESFTSFTKVTDQTASGLEETILKSIKDKGLDISKCRGQGYDGASVMSGLYTGVQQRILQHAPHAYFVHCAAHNLNLVLKDAVQANREISQFFETVQNIYNFFGLSIVRWEKLKHFSEPEDPSSNVTLKTLNPTRWAGRYDAVYALKERYSDVLKALTHFALTSKKANERNEAIGLQKALETFEFVLLLVIQCHVLQHVNIASKSLQAESLDLTQAYDLLGSAALHVAELRDSFESLVEEATVVCSRWGLHAQFSKKRAKKRQKHFDELCEDQRLTDPKDWFKVSVFYPMVDTLCAQLDQRFKGVKRVMDTYRVIQPSFLSSSSDAELSKEADRFVETFSKDVSPLFRSQILSVRSSFKPQIDQMTKVRQLADLLLVEYSTLSSTYPDVCTASVMYLTLPVTVAKAERSFSKLKIIKNYLRSTMSQERLSGLALLSIENEKSRKINVNKVVDVFSERKTRKRHF